MGTSDQEPSSGFVALAFAKVPLHPKDRTRLSESVAKLLGEYFDLPEHQSNYVAVKWQDLDTTNDVSRILQIQSPSKTSPTLAECTKATHSNALTAHQRELDYDLVIQPMELHESHKAPGLAVFDMDSTLIQQEVIDELARAVGLYDKVAAITEAAMQGEAPYTDFEASLRARVALLNGVPTSIWQELKEGVITFTPGVKDLIKVLKALGWKTAVLSGGFTPLANWVKDTLGLDYAYANHLVTNDTRGELTGELVASKPIIHAQKKRELLLQLAGQNGIPVERTIAVGDGSNDLLMMGAAGMGVAFNAKPKVQLAAPARVNGSSLLDVAYILGLSKHDIDQCLTR